MNTPPISPNTQAILLLTAPLILAVRSAPEAPVRPLTPMREYAVLARRLREIGREPADLLGADADSVLDECLDPPGPKLDRVRIEALRGRGVQLGLAVERWQARAIWVLSRADNDYPRRLKRRLREKAPPVLYGCGDRSLLDDGGLAVVGPRNVPVPLLEYAAAIGGLAARSGRTIISGGARGVDRAAMTGVLDAGGRTIGVLASDLARGATSRENRHALRDGRLVLVSPYDPRARFVAGHAMGRNSQIYALADAALVVDALVGRGGTWAGAVVEVERRSGCPVYVRSALGESDGLAALLDRGARPWPEPDDEDGFVEAITGNAQCGPASREKSDRASGRADQDRVRPRQSDLFTEE